MCARNSRSRRRASAGLDQRHRRLLLVTLWITWRITAMIWRWRVRVGRGAGRCGSATPEEVARAAAAIGKAVVEQHHAPGDLLARAAIIASSV